MRSTLLAFVIVSIAVAVTGCSSSNAAPLYVTWSGRVNDQWVVEARTDFTYKDGTLVEQISTFYAPGDTMRIDTQTRYRYSYDAQNRMVETTELSVSSDGFETQVGRYVVDYDERGRFAWDHRFQYDFRAKSEWETVRHEYVYDAKGRLIERQEWLPGQEPGSFFRRGMVSYRYQSDHRTRSVEFGKWSSDQGEERYVKEYVHEYAYDSKGQLKSRVFSDGSSNTRRDLYTMQGSRISNMTIEVWWQNAWATSTNLDIERDGDVLIGEVSYFDQERRVWNSPEARVELTLAEDVPIESMNRILNPEPIVDEMPWELLSSDRWSLYAQ